MRNIPQSTLFLLVGLGFGDEGKGTTVDYLVRKHAATEVVRYTGGSQALHNVCVASGTHHCFSQFGSGALVRDVKTYYAGAAIFDPISLLQEHSALRAIGVEAFSRFRVHPSALISTPFHAIINRMLEHALGANRRSSCGKGIGQTIQDAPILGDYALRAGDLTDPTKLHQKLVFLQQLKLDLAEQIVANAPHDPYLSAQLAKLQHPEYIPQILEIYREVAAKISIDEYIPTTGTVVFEGAQGVLLDTTHGFFPHNTKSDTTLANAEHFIASHYPSADVTRVGILRAYQTRHGIGAMPTESQELRSSIPDVHNFDNEWQTAFRVGWFDLVLAKYACRVVNNLDYLVLTNVDRLRGRRDIKVCIGYQYAKHDGERFFHFTDGIATSIKRRTVPTLAHQEALGEALRCCQPVYRHFGAFDDDAYLAFLEDSLQLPIKIVSSGPTADDKTER